jgi:hypothetical protein
LKTISIGFRSFENAYKMKVYGVMSRASNNGGGKQVESWWNYKKTSKMWKISKL